MFRSLVMKFGGTSVGDAGAIRQVMDIVKESWQVETQRLVIVTSAMSKVTDRLEEGVRCAAAGDLARLEEIINRLEKRHVETGAEILGAGSGSLDAKIEDCISAYRAVCRQVRAAGEVTAQAMDVAMGYGEQLSVAVLSACLEHISLPALPIDARKLIITDGRFQSANPLMRATQAAVQRQLVPHLQKRIPVIAGFIGSTPDGTPTTLGRGGSDYSATLIGAALASDEVWIWTDVDGVMSADPNVHAAAHSIPALNYEEISELAYFGASVLHPKSIRPVIEAGIPLLVKNTFNPGHPGTVILADSKGLRGIKAVTMIDDLSLITVKGKGMLGVPGIAARTFSAAAETGTSVLLISQASSEQSICFAIPRDTIGPIRAAIEAEFAYELANRDIDAVLVLDEVTIVTVVGADVRTTPGIAGRVFTATGNAGINVIAIAQGSTECSISLVVNAAEGDAAVNVIHSYAIASPILPSQTKVNANQPPLQSQGVRR